MHFVITVIHSAEGGQNSLSPNLTFYVNAKHPRVSQRDVSFKERQMAARQMTHSEIIFVFIHL